MSNVKYRPLQLKTIPSDGSGTFTGLAATYGGAPDHQGDVIEYGAFAESILRWRELGDMPPIGLNHKYDKPNARIGKLTSLQEIEDGLLVTGRLNLKNDLAMATYASMLTGALDQLSIGYGVIKEYKRPDGVNVLQKLDLIEVSVTPIPANPRARVLSVKSNEPAPRRPYVVKSALATRTLSVIANWMFATDFNGPEGLRFLKKVQHILTEFLHDGSYTQDSLRKDLDALIEPHLGGRATAKPTAKRTAFDGRSDIAGLNAAHRKVDATLYAQLDALERTADGEKHRLLSTMNSAGVIVHLRDDVRCRVEGRLIEGVAVDIGESGILVAVGDERYLIAPNDVLEASSEVQRQVEQLVADVRAEKKREQKSREPYEQGNLALLSAPIPSIDEDRARDEERFAREEAERQRRDAERYEIAEHAAESERIAQARDWRSAGGADVYWDSTPISHVPEREHGLADVRVTDATPTEPTFRLPLIVPLAERFREDLDGDEHVTNAITTDKVESFVAPVAVTVADDTDDKVILPLLSREDDRPLRTETT